MKSFIVLASALTLGGVASLPPAQAQSAGIRAAHTDNDRQTADLRSRIHATEKRVATAMRSRAITRARAATLNRQIAQTRASMTRLSARQGFVSAGELASYNRTLAAIDLELDRRGVERSYGNDMLVNPEKSYGNDALPSAEVTAFERTHARLRYRDARIEHDNIGCAIYQGRTRNGRVHSVPLLSPDGQRICMSNVR